MLSNPAAVILLDIDGTLLSPSYASNEPKLKATISKMQETGYVFILNSNRSLEDLVPIAKQFSIRGPVIGENGIFCYDPVFKKTDFFLPPIELEKLRVAKLTIENLVQECLRRLYEGQRVYWEEVDTVKLLSGNEARNYEDGSIVALNNKFRKYTVSVHLFEYIRGKLCPIDRLKQIEYCIKTSTSDSNIVITSSKDFSNILMYSSKASKRLAIKSMLRTIKFDTPIFGVGDEMSDYLMVEGVGDFLAVANSPLAVRSRAVKSSRRKYTAGVHELINHIAK